MGPRKIPSCDDLEMGKIRLTDDTVLNVDVDKKCVSVKTGEAGSVTDVGCRLVYIVAP